MTNIARAGLVIGERYQLDARIAAGGMGEIWQATHLTLGSRVAIKLLHPNLLKHANARPRFLNEARVMAQLDTRRVVRVFDFGITTENIPYIVMEFVDGETLSKKRARQGRLSPGTCVRLLGQVARGLERAHALGIVHRDLKPDNILLTMDEDGELQVKVADFGVATLLHGPQLDAFGEQALEAVESQGFVGTPFYMAPEQLRGEGDVTAAVDIWAFGVVAYQCLTGKLPFKGRNLRELVMNVETLSFNTASMIAPVPTAFDDWFFRACAIQPEARYPTMRAAAVGLALALEIQDNSMDRSMSVTVGSISSIPVPAPRSSNRVSANLSVNSPYGTPVTHQKSTDVALEKPKARVSGRVAPTRKKVRWVRYVGVVFGSSLLVATGAFAGATYAQRPVAQSGAVLPLHPVFLEVSGDGGLECIATTPPNSTGHGSTPHDAPNSCEALIRSFNAGNASINASPKRSVELPSYRAFPSDAPEKPAKKKGVDFKNDPYQGESDKPHRATKPAMDPYAND